MLVFQRLFMAAFVVALTTLNLFAEGEPKMPMLNWMGREKAMRPTRTKRYMFNLAVNKSLYGRQGVDRCLYIVNYKNQNR